MFYLVVNHDIYTSITIEYKFITAQNAFDLSHNSDSHLQGRKDQLTPRQFKFLPVVEICHQCQKRLSCLISCREELRLDDFEEMKV